MPEISRQLVRILLVATFVAGVPLVHLGVPFLLAQVGPRWGWVGGSPRLVNWLGALPVLVGVALLGWIMLTMLAAARSLPPRMRLGLRPAHLVKTGPFGRMRHPMYVAESCLWLGSLIYFGSPVVAGVWVAATAFAVGWLIPKEEKALEDQFGDEYRSYRHRVSAIPGWR